MSTEKETAKKATEKKEKAVSSTPTTEKQTVQEATVNDQKKADQEVITKTNEQAINSYYDALKEYFEETGYLPGKELNEAQIYGAISIEQENKKIAEMKRLEEIEANKPKTFTVTDGKQVINVTETTFKYIGKGWKKAPKVPKEVEQLKEEK